MNRCTVGQNVMYFETGQGAALSAGAHHGVDQQTVAARAYAVARHFEPLIVNTVVGFIGPEYLYDGKQIIHAGLEDHFCAKLLGVPMGCDVCYTNHAEADQDDMDNLAAVLTVAGVTFLICVPGADDVMLNYQSLSNHDAVALRATFGLKPAPEFEAWLARVGLADDAGRMIEAKSQGVARLMDSRRVSAIIARAAKQPRGRSRQCPGVAPGLLRCARNDGGGTSRAGCSAYLGLTKSTTELAMNGLVMILVAIALMLLPIFARTPRSDLRDDRNR